MFKKIIVAFFLLIILVVAIYMMLPESSRLIGTTPVGTESTNVTPVGINKGGYTLQEVSSHNSSSDCWSAIDGKVYNLTDWIGRHPGGSSEILRICGIDGSKAFNEQHAGQGEPLSNLSEFYVGELK